MKIEQAISVLKENKIGKGCKISTTSNKIYIEYPFHKVFVNCSATGQYFRDSKMVKELFATNEQQHVVMGNKGGINIWI